MSNSEGLTCPVCLNVYFRPINLPCGHILCEVCLERSLQEATLGCPICRHRLSNWKRHVTNLSNCINRRLEEKIKRLFPQYYINKQMGLDTTLCESELETLRNITNDPLPPIRIAPPGAIRAEYEEAVAKASELSVQEEADLAMSRYMLLESVDSVDDDNDENIHPLESTPIENLTQNHLPLVRRLDLLSRNRFRRPGKIKHKPVIKRRFGSVLKSHSSPNKSLALLKTYNLRSKATLACSKNLRSKVSPKQFGVDMAACLKYFSDP